VRTLPFAVVISSALALFCGRPAAAQGLVINEIHYNPSEAQGADEDFEFFEIVNDGTEPVQLDGFTVGYLSWITFTFSAGHVIGAGEHIVIARNASSYAAKGYQVFQWEGDGDLVDKKGTLQIIDPSGAIVDTMNYFNHFSQPSWPSSPDGYGPSLERIVPLLEGYPPAIGWQPSFAEYGTPGAANSIALNTFYIDRVVVNPGDKDVQLDIGFDAVDAFSAGQYSFSISTGDQVTLKTLEFVGRALDDAGLPILGPPSASNLPVSAGTSFVLFLDFSLDVIPAGVGPIMRWTLDVSEDAYPMDLYAQVGGLQFSKAGIPVPMAQYHGFVTVNHVFISEYVEGDGSDRAIEIVNPWPFGLGLDLSGFSLWRITDGGDWPEASLALTGKLEPLQTLVVCHPDAQPALLAKCDVTDAVLDFDGNDAIGLARHDTLVDSVGEAGADPGAGWSVAGVAGATADHTLRRKAAVAHGNTVWPGSAGSGPDDSEWVVASKGAFDHLGVSPAATEICDNSTDDDGDGLVDCFDSDCSDSFPTVGLACDGDDDDLCANGAITCTADGAGVECVGESVESIVETCDGQDADCDGLVDCNDPDCSAQFPLLEQPCDGPDSDQCANGAYVCTPSGGAVMCLETVENLAEVCDGQDADCDSLVDCHDPDCDEQFPGLGDPCDTADSDDCANGVSVCTADGSALECPSETVEDVEEICDELDNDCDGDTDEGLECDEPPPDAVEPMPDAGPDEVEPMPDAGPDEVEPMPDAGPVVVEPMPDAGPDEVEPMPDAGPDEVEPIPDTGAEEAVDAQAFTPLPEPSDGCSTTSSPRAPSHGLGFALLAAFGLFAASRRRGSRDH